MHEKYDGRQCIMAHADKVTFAHCCLVITGCFRSSWYRHKTKAFASNDRKPDFDLQDGVHKFGSQPHVPQTKVQHVFRAYRVIQKLRIPSLCSHLDVTQGVPEAAAFSSCVIWSPGNF